MRSRDVEGAARKDNTSLGMPTPPTEPEGLCADTHRPHNSIARGRAVGGTSTTNHSKEPR